MPGIQYCERKQHSFCPPVVTKLSVPISTHYTTSEAEYRRLSSFTLRNKQLIIFSLYSDSVTE